MLDVGGARGAYALRLAREGYEVHLIDPWKPHVDAAVAASAAQPGTPLSSAAVGDARRLPFADASADAVLLLGPLYHLPAATDRAHALAEACRVLRTGGVLLAAGISRFASTFDGIHLGLITDPTFERIVVGDLRSGVHRNPDPEGRPEWFTLAYFHMPEELNQERRRVPAFVSPRHIPMRVLVPKRSFSFRSGLSRAAAFSCPLDSVYAIQDERMSRRATVKKATGMVHAVGADVRQHHDALLRALLTPIAPSVVLILTGRRAHKMRYKA